MDVVSDGNVIAAHGKVRTAPSVGERTGPGVMRVRADAPGSPAKISIKNLDFFYGDTQALKSVTLDLPQKQVTGLIGPSGCGKSTLLRVLNRMYDLYPEQRVTGEVRLDDQDILGPEVDVNLLRSRVGMVFQEPTALPMSICDNIAFGPKIYQKLSRDEADGLVQESLTRAAIWTEVKDRLDEPAGSLSIGQQQRLCIARALASRPEVILMDEPTSALDPVSSQKIEELIAELKQNLTIAIVTHNMEQAARCADKVAFFYLGEMVEVGSTQQIFSTPRQPRTQNYIAGRFG
jgi:phosphate transport system ATP-binding protein